MYSQVFVRKPSIVRHTSLFVVERWCQLSVLLKSTLPNKVKQFVPILSPQSVYRGKVCYLFDCATLCMQRSDKGHFSNFQWSAVTSHHSQYGNYRTGSAFDDAHAPCYK